jgi:hypothetical protein
VGDAVDAGSGTPIDIVVLHDEGFELVLGPKAGAGSAHAEPPRSPMLKAATAIDEDMTLKAASCHLVQPARQDIESQRADFQMALRNRQAT